MYHVLNTTTEIAHHVCPRTSHLPLRITYVHAYQIYHALNTTTPQRITHISSAFTHHACLHASNISRVKHDYLHRACPRTFHLPSRITYVHAHLICLQTYQARLPASRIMHISSAFTDHVSPILLSRIKPHNYPHRATHVFTHITLSSPPQYIRITTPENHNVIR